MVYVGSWGGGGSCKIEILVKLAKTTFSVFSKIEKHCLKPCYVSVCYGIVPSTNTQKLKAKYPPGTAQFEKLSLTRFSLDLYLKKG